jgi:Protein of unknown function (DUF3237)
MKERVMEFLVEFEFNVPEWTSEFEVEQRERADWQTILPDGTALGDIRYTLQTNGGDLLYVQSRRVRHGPAEVLARLGRGEDVDPGEYTLRAVTQLETAAPKLDWLNKGVFISVAGRQAAGVVYKTYLVG